MSEQRERPSVLVSAVLVLAALGSLAGAYAMRPVELVMPEFEDTGELMFPAFEDPQSATSLEVVQYDDKAAKTRAFSVAFKDGRWVIPSHNDYPADAVDRLAAAASSFVGVHKDIYRGDKASSYAGFGVEDPASGDASGEGRGIRVRIADKANAALVDVILGKKVPDKPGYRFMREAAGKRVYAVKIKLDISTKFAEWIDADLLQVKRDEIVSVTSDSYRVDEATGLVDGHKAMRFELRGAGDWVQVQVPKGPGAGASLKLGQAPVVALEPGQQVSKRTVSGLLGGLDQLKIAGVRAQPKRLTQGVLRAKGIFLSEDQKMLIGNDGQLSYQTRDGITCTVYFGEVSYEQGEALTAGLEAATSSPPPDKDAKAHRYIFVTVGYQEALDETLGQPPPVVKEGETPPLRGKAHAQALRQRFDRWFYVVDNASFEKLHLAPADFFEAAKG